MKKLNQIDDATLIRFWNVAFNLLVRYQSKRAFVRLNTVVAELDRRGI